MANLNRLIPLSFLLLPASANAIVFGNGVGEVTLTGFTKLADGTHARAFPNFDLDLNNPPKGITGKAVVPVQTSKGVFSMEIFKTATVDTSKLGSKVVSLAKRVGPLGLAIGAADLICSLTSICNQAGEWMMQQVDFGSGSGHYPTCQEAIGLSAGESFPACDTITNQYPNVQWFRAPANPPANAGCVSRGGVGWIHSANAFECSTPPTVSAPINENDWDSKASSLNDDRFTPHLISAGEPVPLTGLPVTPPGQTQKVHQQSVPVRDSSGNVTGRDDSETVIEAVDAATAEAPGKVVIKETTTTKRYDNNNTLISTSETTNYTAQTQETQPQSFEIKFDEVAPAELQTYSVPNTFDSTSWGGGSCPDDVTVSVAGHTFAIPSQPVCDTAVMINPFVLLISTLIGVYIISGVRSGSAT